MTNLRWIESEIDRLIFSIEQLKKLNKNGDVTIQEKRLTHLNQIKPILEEYQRLKDKETPKNLLKKLYLMAMMNKVPLKIK